MPFHITRPLGIKSAITATSIAFSVSMFSLASQANADAAHGHISSHGRFTPNVVGANWPPQPRLIENQRLHSPQDSGAAAQGNRVGSVGIHDAVQIEINGANTAIGVALASSNVATQLGENYAQISSSVIGNKWGESSKRFKVTFFSHSRNQTVVAIIEDGELDEVKTIPAAASQPPLADSEMTRAISIARGYWQNEGNARIGLLTGYAIQTFLPDNSFYGTRVVYVSFHLSSNHEPELLTWVDLTNQTVLRGTTEQGQ